MASPKLKIEAATGKGMSLHIGLNRIDAAHYGTDGLLSGCENDANAMQRIAASLGYQTTTLLTTDARAETILDYIRSAAAQLNAGDTFLLTYAGHGAQVGDTSGDEGDGNGNDYRDETWCAFDRMIIDDEFAALWGNFRQGVRIVMVSDSCHSGTVLRALPAIGIELPIVFRTLPAGTADNVYRENRGLYDGLRAAARQFRSRIRAGVILLAGCQDDQLAADGDGNGFFTENLLNVWNDGRFQGDYRAFIDQIDGTMSLSQTRQTPRYTTDGEVESFESQQPFRLTSLENSRPCNGGEQSETTNPTTKEKTIMVAVNGNWEEVAAEISRRTESTRGQGEFLSRVIAANAAAAEAAYFGSNNRAVSGSVFRAFWWGFHVEIAHNDLASLLNTFDPRGPIADFFRRILPADYARWIDVVAPFVAASLNLIRGLDRGRGVYLSMSWFAPGFVVPTTV